MSRLTADERSPLARRAARLWPAARRLFWATTGIAVVGLAVQGWLSGSIGRTAEEIGVGARDLTVDAGFSVQELTVSGRVRTTPDEILDALGLRRGDPIFSFDPDVAKTALEALPWVRNAAVIRRLPDSIEVRLVERQPLAVWQNEQHFRVIDDEGRVLAEQVPPAMAALPMIVGPDAPEHAAGFLGLLAAAPVVAERVEASVRVGGRRWDLVLDNGIRVRLPESAVDQALERLTSLQQADGLFDRDVLVIDMRLEDRLVVQTSPLAAERRRLPEQTI